MSASPPPTPIRTLALIDDDDDDEFFMRRTLRKAGFAPRVVRILNGGDAVKYFSRHGRYADENLFPRADLVFLDINMPGLSGFEVLSWLQHHPAADRPMIVMLSSSDLSHDRERAFSLGADCYLSKPASVATLQSFAAQHGLTWADPHG